MHDNLREVSSRRNVGLKVDTNVKLETNSGFFTAHLFQNGL